MRSLLAISACALLALSAPAFAQSASTSTQQKLNQNASPNGSSYTHAKQPGSTDTESGKAPSEGRASATETNGVSGTANTNGDTAKMKGGTGVQTHTGANAGAETK
jgi:hypothetical protein